MLYIQNSNEQEVVKITMKDLFKVKDKYDRIRPTKTTIDRRSSAEYIIYLSFEKHNVSDIEDLKAKIVTKYPELAKHSQDDLKHLKDTELTQLNTSSIIGGRIVDYAFKVGYMDFVITARVMIVA